jgi:hypothetical protein
MSEPLLFVVATLGVICIGTLVGLAIVAIMDWGRDLHE